MTAFPPDTVAFLRDLRRHNDKAWFEANRARYQAAYVQPAVAFVAAIAPPLERIVPGIRAEAKVLGSIFRINRDTRFSTDKTPYKDHLDLWFWEGERKAAVSGLFLRVSPDGVTVGAGAHGFSPEQLRRYRAAVDDELSSMVRTLERGGNEVGGETYVRTPRGFDGDERLLRHSALYVHDELPAAVASDPSLSTLLVQRWKAYAPLHRWLVDRVQTAGT
jgi:uncharacterized protein (TIGR02453 family)